MDQSLKDARYYLRMFIRRKRLVAGIAVAGSVLAALIAMTLPSVYRSTAKVLIEEPGVPRDIVQSTVSGYADQRIQSISQRVMTTPKLISLLEKYDLYPEARARRPITEVVEKFRRSAGLDMEIAPVRDPNSGKPTNATIGFSLYFEHENPRTAQQVANELVSLYLAENLIDRQNKVAETTSFLDEESARLGDRIRDLEGKIAKFKEEHTGQLPEQIEVNLTGLERINRESAEIDRQIQALMGQRTFLETELSSVDRFSTYIHDGAPVQSASEQLKAAVAKYASLKGVYGEAHPDMVKLRREIQTLSAAAGDKSGLADMSREVASKEAELAALKEKYSDSHPQVIRAQKELDSLRASISDGTILAAGAAAATSAPDNPAYLQLRSRIQSVDLELKAARDRKEELAEARKTYEQRVLGTPEVERQYKLLLRDYENDKAKYQELKAKQLEAQLSEALEADRKSERFTLIDPPALPSVPERPNRPLMLSLGLLMSLAGGLGLALVLDLFDNAVYGERQLAYITGEPPLVSVPHISAAQGQGPRGRRPVDVLRRLAGPLTGKRAGGRTPAKDKPGENSLEVAS